MSTDAARPYKIGYRMGGRPFVAEYRSVTAARAFRSLLLGRFTGKAKILWTEGFLDATGAREFWYLFQLEPNGPTHRALFGSQAELEAFGRGLASINDQRAFYRPVRNFPLRERM